MTSNDTWGWNNTVYNTQGYQMGICSIKNASIDKFSNVWPPIDSLIIARERTKKKKDLNLYLAKSGLSIGYLYQKMHI